MPTIQELKEKFPVYKDIPDAQLADNLYNNIYKHRMSREEFNIRAGLDETFDPASRLQSTKAVLNDAVTLGFSDEIAGAVRFVGDAIADAGKQASNTLFDTDFETEGISNAAFQGFEEGRDEQRAKIKIAKENLGYAALPLQIIAGIGSGAPVKSALTGALRLIDIAKTGAGFGAITGFGSSEGGLENRLQGTAQGAAVGATAAGGLKLAGDAVNPLIQVGQNVSQAVGRGLGRVPSSKAVADARLAQSLRDADLTPSQANLRLREFQDNKKPVTIADLDPVLRRQGRNVKVASPEADRLAQNLFTNRAQKQVQRINDDLRIRLRIGDKSFKGELDNLVFERKRIAGPLYKEAFKRARHVDISKEINDLFRLSEEAAGSGQTQLKKAIKLFQKTVKQRDAQGNLVDRTVNKTSLQELHNAKIALDDMLAKPSINPTSLNKSVQSTLTDFKNKILQQMDVFNPKYGQARQIFSDAKTLERALQNGRDFLKGDAEFLAQNIARMPKSEKDMFAVGVVREVNKMIGRKRLGLDVTNTLNTPNVRDALHAVFPDERSFKRFYEDIGQEIAFVATKNKILGGSDTAEKASDLLDASFIRRAMTSLRQPVTSLVDGFTTLLERSFKMNQNDATALARIMFETDPALQRETLRRLQSKYGAKMMRAARKRLTKSASGLFASAARVAGSETAITENLDPLPNAVDSTQ